jgi:hypothetical protein
MATSPMAGVGTGCTHHTLLPTPHLPKWLLCLQSCPADRDHHSDSDTVCTVLKLSHHNQRSNKKITLWYPVGNKTLNKKN